MLTFLSLTLRAPSEKGLSQADDSGLKPGPRLLLFADLSLKALTEHQRLSSLEQQYNQEITDLKQPVLVSQPKRRRGPGGTLPGPAMLIPELCYLTGTSRASRAC